MAILQLEMFEVKGDERRCFRCKRLCPLTVFTSNKNGPGGLSYYCRDCKAERYTKYRTSQRAAYWLSRYGISEQVYWDMFDQQGGVCAICGNPETIMQKGTLAALVIDHDHETGAVRGLLCKSCNLGIGNLRDDVALLESAIVYLRKIVK